MRKETEKLEFKKSTGEIKEAIISLASMLNKHGEGRLIFGISPKGFAVKNQISESSLRDISRKIYEGIEPRIYPLIDIIVIDEVEVIEVVVECNEQPYSAFGRHYIRTADEDRELGSNELKRIISNLTFLDSWETQLTEFGLEDIDETALISFFEEATKYGRLPELEFNAEKLLGKLGLYREN